MDQSPEHKTLEPGVEATGQEIRGSGVNLEEITTDADRESLIGWGSILAGLFVLIATSWLLYPVGITVGVRIVGATEGDAVGTGLGIAAVIWILISSLIAYFQGSLMAARISGKTTSAVATLHGLTLWVLAFTLLSVLSYMGVTSLPQTAAESVSSAVSTGASDTSSTIAHAVDAGQSVASAADTELAGNIQARLNRCGTPLAQGKTQSAQHHLTANTRSNGRHINAIFGDFRKNVTRTISRFQNEAT